jgi:ADP-ribosylglycohydrolase
MDSLDRRGGALLGLAVGDALGTTNEFTMMKAPPFPTLAVGPVTSIIGGGPFDVAAGQVTDDSQMATALATSLRELGHFDVTDVAGRYVIWRKAAFDVGTQTGAALSLVASGTSPEVSGKAVWASSGQHAAGNGSLMRTAPIAVHFLHNADLRRDASFLDSAITHFDPRCQLACAAFNAAIAACFHGAVDVTEMFAAARAELDGGAQQLIAQGSVDAGLAEAARTALRADLDAAETDDPGLYGDDLHLVHHQGFVRVAFRLAFWELAHAPTFKSALVDVVNRGGDADTNGAITGALVGALHGQKEIPQDWADAVLGALEGSTGPFATTYHPKLLLELLSLH